MDKQKNTLELTNRGLRTNNKNIYDCQNNVCNKSTVTIDIDVGTTPMMILCPSCRKYSYSRFYPDVAQNLTPTHEWYYPTKEVIWQLINNELETFKKDCRKHPRKFFTRRKYISQNFLSHWKKGGLFLRPIFSLINIDLG